MSVMELAFAEELRKIALFGKKKPKGMFPTFRRIGRAAKWGGLGLGALLAYGALKGATEAKDEIKRERESY